MLISLGKWHCLPLQYLRMRTITIYAGEIAGFGVSIAKQYGSDMRTVLTSYRKAPLKSNSTTTLDEDILLHNGLTNNEIWRFRFNRTV
jgi:hypothetical protein